MPGTRNGMAATANNCLIFDADDTLWENNIYFEKAIEEFFEAISDIIHPVQPTAPNRDAVLDLLNEIERESIPRCGYGSCYFVDSLRETFRRVYGGADGVAYLRAIDEIGLRLINHPIDILPEVASTLEALRSQCRLMVLTKGDFDEQSSKIDRSGLKHHFHCVEVVREKNAATYHDLVERHSLHRDSAVMIGNSPRSDIIPALQAGLWAVFVPHPHTWDLEHDDIPPHPRLLVAKSLREVPKLLREIFPSEPRT